MDTNTIAFIGLANEYCGLIANPFELEEKELTARLLRLLPRIYICATDLKGTSLTDEPWIDSALSEEQYDDARRQLASVFGENDVYLEVFEEDMKYSDTPVAASISENLADIYQALYDFLATVRDATDDVAQEAVVAVKSSFREYWSSTLCNVLRAVNHLWATGVDSE